MNKDNILQQMADVVEATMGNYKSDFYNVDKGIIEGEVFKFPFIWIVGKCHTHMFQLGNYKDDFFASESYRYDYLRNPNPWEYFFNEKLYQRDKWFLVTENGLQSINLDQAKAAIKDYIAPAVNAWVNEHGPLPKLTKVPVKFNDAVLSELKSLIADCRLHGNDSLLDVFKRRQKSCRVADDQVEIYQWYITDCSKWDMEYLRDTFGLLFTYSDMLDCYILCVTHFGTGWDYVDWHTTNPNAECKCGEKK